MSSKYRLPNKLIALSNPDKQFHERWSKSRNMLDIPHPYRAICLGPPNCGKSTTVKNLLVRANPPFEKITVIHCDPEYTQEYDDLGSDVEIMGSVPAPEDWEGEQKTLVILDDLEFKSMNKEQMRNLDRLFGYVSTHKNISCILCSQDSFNVPACVRRCCNVFILWKMTDIDSMACTARKTGLKASNLKNIFDTLMTEPKDSLWIDLTSHTPYPLRKNGFQKIKKELGTDSKKEKEKQDKFEINNK